MARPRSVNKSDLERAVAVALAQNLTIREILVEPGSARVIIGAGAQLRHHPVQPFGVRDDGPALIEPM